MRGRSVLVLLAMTAVTMGSGCSAQPEGAAGIRSAEPIEAATSPGQMDSATDAAEPTTMDRSNDEAAIREYVTKKEQCINEAGFRAEMQDDGGLRIYDPPPEQKQAWEEVIRACEGTLGPVPGNEPFSTEELSVLYDLQLELGDCLEENGYTVSEPSTRETFIAQYQALQDGEIDDGDWPWSPLMGINDPASIEVCPQPTGEDVYDRMTESSQG